MSIKIFSVIEANFTLQKIIPVFHRIFYLHEQIHALSSDIKNLHHLWGNEILESTHTDHHVYKIMIHQRKQYSYELKTCIQDIQKTGCVVKDIQSGLVDFYFRAGNRVVMLCWKYGENRIKYWHGINSGFVNRRPIEELTSSHEPEAVVN